MTTEILSDEAYEEVQFVAIEMERETAVSHSQFSDCAFINCRFPEHVFQACRFTRCTFKQCDLSLAAVPKTSFISCRFEQCSLIGINWSAADWPSAKLSQPLRFVDCNLSHATFIGLKLHGIRFENGRLHDVDFRETDLTRAVFDGCDLEQSRFQQTNLTRADLRRAKNYRINPSLNVLTQAQFALPEALALLYSLDINLEEAP